MLMTTDPGDLVLDPTCGSGTTAYVAEQWGRRWITVDTSRVALALARTRLMSARYPYYLLADSPAGLKKEAELRGKSWLTSLPPGGNEGGLPATEGDLRKGFVYRRVPHIMLKDIANNQEIDAIHAKWQAQLDPILKDLAGFPNLPGLNPGWQEWQLPRDPGPDWPPAAQKLLAQYWQLRRQRQADIEASISRQAEQEILYDQPFEDKSTVRVTGPFTVESLSPHRVLSPAQPLPDSERQAKREADAGQFESMILDNLRKAGVQNTKKGERLKFDRLELTAGEYLQGEGDYTEAPPSPPSTGSTPPAPPSTGGLGGVKKRVAVAIGPEFGTVGKQLLQAAAREAVRGLGYDLLLVCGFAFDPDVSEEAKQMGRLTVLPVRMNPDLSMGDTLLKKTGSGNLFMIFGEPDVTVSRTPAGQVVVELKGLDIYDPTTGQIRNSSLDDIACWFIDTAYNGQSFFVRHAYFTGAGEPYDQLKRALRADINEEAWAALYRPISLPFDPPPTGQIAVKVINHYGDEALKVFEVK
jgi:adenine-specific DNA-methyltransferase